jgi:uncharacterized damage-inducible protein DinB
VGRSVGDVAAHIAFGRIDWFHRMGAPGSAELAERVAAFSRPGGDLSPESGIAEDAAELVRWLETSWQMVEKTLRQLTITDLTKTFLQPYQGKTYAVSRQWTIWRIMAHDIHHGGQLTAMLYAQGVELLELGYLGGHLTEPTLAEAV